MGWLRSFKAVIHRHADLAGGAKLGVSALSIADARIVPEGVTAHEIIHITQVATPEFCFPGTAGEAERGADERIGFRTGADRARMGLREIGVIKIVAAFHA